MLISASPCAVSNPARIALCWPKFRDRLETVDARVLQSEALDHLPGAVLRAIVDKQDGRAADHLLSGQFVEQGAKPLRRFQQHLLFVVARDDNGQCRAGSAGTRQSRRSGLGPVWLLILPAGHWGSHLDLRSDREAMTSRCFASAIFDTHEAGRSVRMLARIR